MTDAVCVCMYDCGCVCINMHKYVCWRFGENLESVIVRVGVPRLTVICMHEE